MNFFLFSTGQLPNIITMLRLVLVPLVVMAVVEDHYFWAFVGFALAGSSDALDGFIARRWNQRSELGAFLDPLADKVMLVSLVVTLALTRSLPFWLATLIVFRDVIIMGGVVVAWMLERPIAIEPLKISKLNTLVQILLVGTLLAHKGLTWDLSVVVQVLLPLTALLTLASALAYVAVWLQHMSEPA